MRQDLLPRIVLVAYLALLMLPIYWLINMSLRTNTDIMSGLGALAASSDDREIHRHFQ